MYIVLVSDSMLFRVVITTKIVLWRDKQNVNYFRFPFFNLCNGKFGPGHMSSQALFGPSFSG